MKKLSSLLLAAGLTVSLTACGGSTAAGTPADNVPALNRTAVPMSEPVLERTKASDSTLASTSEPAAEDVLAPENTPSVEDTLTPTTETEDGNKVESSDIEAAPREDESKDESDQEFADILLELKNAVKDKVEIGDIKVIDMDSFGEGETDEASKELADILLELENAVKDKDIEIGEGKKIEISGVKVIDLDSLEDYEIKNEADKALIDALTKFTSVLGVNSAKNVEIEDTSVDESETTYDITCQGIFSTGEEADKSGSYQFDVAVHIDKETGKVTVNPSEIKITKK